MDFFEHINQGESYCCDRCNVVELRYDEYINNRKNGFIYCDECYIYIELQKYKCIYCTQERSFRSERLLPFECECGGLTVCLSK